MNGFADPAAAGALLAQYGPDAAVIATLRAAEAAALGDAAGCAHWSAMAEALEAFAAPAAPTEPPA